MTFRGCSSMVEQQPSKLMTRVRFPSPAPIFSSTCRHVGLAILTRVLLLILTNVRLLFCDARRFLAPAATCLMVRLA